MNASKSSKRPKRGNLETRSLIDSQSDVSSNQSEHFIQFDETDLDELKQRTEKILTQSQKDQRINDLTNLFKEILNSNSNQQQEKHKLSSLFTLLLEYLSFNSTSLEDKLVSQIALLLALQVPFKPKINDFFFIV